MSIPKSADPPAEARKPPRRRTAPAVRPRNIPEERPGPEDGKRAENRRRRTGEIATAALELFLASGIAAVTIDEITRRAGVAKGSFYRYFKGRDDLVDALIEPLTTEVRAAFHACDRHLGAATKDDLAGAYLSLAASLAAAVAGHQDVVRLYLQESRGPAAGARRPIVELSDEIARRAVELTVVATEHGLLRPPDPRVSGLAVVGAAERLLQSWLADPEHQDAGAMTAALVSMVLDGLRP